MQQRDVLGTADVTDDRLRTLVATLWGEAPGGVQILDSRAEVVDYDLPSLTTAGRYRVRGTAEVCSTRKPFCFFVKHVQSWSRSAMFAEVPPDIAAMAEASVP